MAESKPFNLYGNEKTGLNQIMFLYNYMKKLQSDKNIKNLSLRCDKNGKHFFIFENLANGKISAITTIKSTVGNYEIVSLGSVKYAYDKNNNDFIIRLITVNPTNQNCGIGNAIMDYLKTLAFNSGCKTISLRRICTFTNGKEQIILNVTKTKEEIIEKLGSQGNAVVDKNEIFYKKHGFIDNEENFYENMYLIPMILKNIIPVYPNISHFAQTLKFKLVKPTAQAKQTYKTPIKQPRNSYMASSKFSNVKLI